MMPELPERKVDGQRVFDGRVVKLDVDQVVLANGHETQREVVRHPGAVMIVPVDADGNVLLIRQYRYAAGEVLLELPAGTLDHDAESPLACAQRELIEETGFAAATWQHLATFYTTPGFTDELMHCYLATDLTPCQDGCAEPDESIELTPVPLKRAEALARNGELRDAKTIAGILLATQMQ